jgi:regulatory protein
VSDEAFDLALSRAYRHLGRRDRTVAEVRKHLLVKEADAGVVEAVLEELATQGYLDDARYAERFADDRRRLDGWGPDRIARKLAETGVARAHIDAALADRDHASDLETAVALLRRRLREPPQDDRARDRALGFLVRKGYDLELAYDAVRAFR